MPLILGTNSIKDTGYDVANSVRYNDGDSPKLNINFGSDGTLNKWTFSMWFKRSTLGTAQRLFCVLDSGMDDYIKFDTSDQLEWTFDHEDGSNRGVLKTNRKFRDVSAWYHLVCRLDTTDSTAGDRMRMYINGTEETSFATDTNPTLNETGDIGRDNNHYIGTSGSSQYFDGYIAEVCMINNQSLEPTSFGEFDSDSPNIWKPIDISGLTPGTNGFFLDFEDSSNLGNDAFGGTDWTETNLAATDQSTDTCTNNFATLNPLISRGSDSNQTQVLSNGNLHVTGNQASWCHSRGTFGASSGKWYWEVKLNGSTMGNLNIGVSNAGTNMFGGTVQSLSGNTSIYGDGQYNINGSITGSQSPTFSSGDICGVALNMDNNTVSFYKNGTILSWGTDLAISGGTDDVWLPASAVYNTSESLDFNFGSPPFTISSGNSDANGYGNFEYAVPSGYYALCTKNLAEYG
jgi:hypothetical protein